jgi:hypothetical protein
VHPKNGDTREEGPEYGKHKEVAPAANCSFSVDGIMERGEVPSQSHKRKADEEKPQDHETESSRLLASCIIHDLPNGTALHGHGIDSRRLE